jgi:chromatin structure-remodeling complex protein RSC7
MHGVYDPHTNTMMYPRATQPTHAKWEELPIEPNHAKALTNGVSELTNGVHKVSLNGVAPEDHHRPSGSIFSSIPPVVSRNFLVTDTYYQSPPISNLGIPGPDGDMLDVGPNGLPHVTEDVMADLPPECLQALVEAKAKEAEWKATWKTETEDGARGRLNIRFLGFPN